MDRARQDAFCCGGGDGNVFNNVLNRSPQPPAHSLALKALTTRTVILAESCPTCAVMLEEAVFNNTKGRIQFKEISEIIAGHLLPEHPSPPPTAP